MYQKTCGNILYDGYAVPLPEYPYWRRPTVEELYYAIEKRSGPLFNMACKLSNSIKAHSILSPKTYVFPYWLMNNPLLFILSTLPKDNQYSIDHFYEYDNIRLYVGTRGFDGFSQLFNTLYPTDFSRKKKKNSSYLDDIYSSDYNRAAFYTFIQSPMQSFLRNNLAKLEGRLDRCTIDPHEIMTERLHAIVCGKFQINSGSISSYESNKVFDYLLNHFVKINSDFDMTTAREAWRKAFGEELIAKGNEIDWMLRENIYLPSHVDSIIAKPAVYNKFSLECSNLHLLQNPVKIDSENFSFIGRSWPIQITKNILSFESTLEGLSFEIIFEEILQSDFHREYVKRICSISEDGDFSNSFNQLFDALSYLFGEMAPILFKYTGNEIYKNKFLWTVSDLFSTHNSLLCTLSGGAAGMALYAAGSSLSIPIGLALGAVSGGLLNAIRKKPDRYNKRRGRGIFTALARAN